MQYYTFEVFLYVIITFFYKVVENGDFANAINFTVLINSSDVGIIDVVEIAIAMDRYFIVPDCALYIIYIFTYAFWLFALTPS